MGHQGYVEHHATTARWIRALAWASTVGLYVVILIGFLDTQTGSALGCGAMWPLCNGGVLPGPSIQSLIEYGHRAITGLVGILVVVVVATTWRRAGDVSEIKVAGAVGLGFVVVQAILGAMAVVATEPPVILALHLGFALLAFSGIVLLLVVILQTHRQEAGMVSGLSLRHRPVSHKMAVWVWAGLAYTYVVVYLGAFIQESHSGAGCSGWPLCNGMVIPPLHGATGIVFAHRVAAVLIVTFLTVIWVLARRDRARRPDLYRGAMLTMGLVWMQALSGAYVVFSHRSITANIVHVAILTCLFAAESYLCLQVLPRGAVVRQNRTAVEADQHIGEGRWR